MKAKRINRVSLCIALMLVFCNHLSAQSLIAVQNGSRINFFTNLDSAVTQAQINDTVYLPGGIFPLNVFLTRPIHIIGVGHNPDSTQATNPSIIINSNSAFVKRNYGGSITGVKFSGPVIIDSSTTNFTISRCSFGALTLHAGSSGNLFYGNLISGTIYGNSSKNNFFHNNVIYGGIRIFGSGNHFRNNIIGVSDIGSCNNFTPSISIISGSTFVNNIIRATVCLDNSIFTNNLITSSVYLSCNSCIASSNIVFSNVDSIFIRYRLGSSLNYSDNYQLQANSPGKNAGTDGTDIGVFGGDFKWKEGSLPSNPHVQFKKVSSFTEANGTLPVNIRVAAQSF